MQTAYSRHLTNLHQARFLAWRSRGLSTRAATAVSLACCDSIVQVTNLGREYFEQLPNCAEKTLQELALLAGWPPKRSTAVEAIAAALALSINDPEQTREIATDVMIALRRSGYAVVASTTAPGGSR